MKSINELWRYDRNSNKQINKIIYTLQKEKKNNVKNVCTAWKTGNHFMNTFLINFLLNFTVKCANERMNVASQNHWVSENVWKSCEITGAPWSMSDLCCMRGEFITTGTDHIGIGSRLECYTRSHAHPQRYTHAKGCNCGRAGEQLGPILLKYEYPVRWFIGDFGVFELWLLSARSLDCVAFSCLFSCRHQLHSTSKIVCILRTN